MCMSSSARLDFLTPSPLVSKFTANFNPRITGRGRTCPGAALNETFDFSRLKDNPRKRDVKDRLLPLSDTGNTVHDQAMYGSSSR